MTDVRGIVWPAYFVADESASMSPVVGELNAGLTSVHSALLVSPMTAAKVRFSVIGFSDTAVNRLALQDLRELAAMPQLSTRSTTNYGAAFQYLYEQLPADVEKLKADGYQVHRPAVFFLTDGQPTDIDGNLTDDSSWSDIHRRLTDKLSFRYAPNVMAFGIGGARAQTILKVATSASFAFITIAGTDVGQAIVEFVKALTNSMVKSAQSLATGQGDLVIEVPTSFRLAVDLV
jgi:uncharacterized protein YegL